jgi:hypothetical protein
MPSSLFPAELFILVGINIFVALSLLTSLFDDPFPLAVPYVFQVAALAGFGQIWVNYAFLFSFVETRFWCSMLYLTVAVANTIAVNVYIAFNKRLLSAAGIFLGAFTIPTIFVSFVSVSSYVNGIAIPVPAFPIVPVQSLYFILALCVVILGFSVAASLEPGMLGKAFGIHRKHQLVSGLFDYALNPREAQKNIEKKGGENE